MPLDNPVKSTFFLVVKNMEVEFQKLHGNNINRNNYIINKKTPKSNKCRGQNYNN